MAQPTCVELDKGSTTSDQASYATNSKTFTHGRLYVLYIGDTATTPLDPTSVKLTVNTSEVWTKGHTGKVANTQLGIYYVYQPAADKTDTVTIDYNGVNQSGQDWIIFEITGHGSTDGTALGAVAQFKDGSQASTTHPSVAFATAPFLSSLTIGFCFSNVNAALTAGTNFTKVSETAGHASPAARMAGEKDNGTSQQTVDWTVSNSNVVVGNLEIYSTTVDGAFAAQAASLLTVVAGNPFAMKAAADFEVAGTKGVFGPFSIVGASKLGLSGGGAGWRQAIPSDTNRSGAVDPSNPLRTVLLSSAVGVEYSPDQLLTFASALPSGFTAYGVDVDEYGVIWAFGKTAGGVIEGDFSMIAASDLEVAGIIPDVHWTPSGIHGGGFINAIAPDPSTQDRWLCIGDTAGVQETLDGGLSWNQVNTGLYQPAFWNGAAITFDPVNPLIVHIGMGTSTSVFGNHLRSTDGGTTWAPTNTTDVCFFGQGNVAGPGSGAPRSVGHGLILVDGSNIYDGSASNYGVKRSTDAGVHWTQLGSWPLTSFVRDMEFDPDDHTTIFVGLYPGASSNGMKKITGANGATPVVTQVAAFTPDVCEEITFTSNAMYVAAGVQGIWYSADKGATFHQISSGLDTVTSQWSAIVGRSIDGDRTHDVLFAGCFHPQGQTNIARSTDGGATWVNITPSAHIHTTVLGQSFTWFIVGAGPQYLLGTGGQGVVQELWLDPFDNNKLYVTGHSGVWKTSNANASNPDFYPAVYHLEGSGNDSVQVDPDDSRYVYAFDDDWKFQASADYGVSFTQSAPVPEPTGWAKDAVTKTVFVGGTGLVSGAQVVSCPDPTVPSPVWTDLGWPSAAFVASLGCGYDLTNDEIVVAPTVQDGLYRLRTGIWTKRTVPLDVFVTPDSHAFRSRKLVVWVYGTQVVFAWDPMKMLIRSLDAGDHWSAFWTHTSTATLPHGLIQADRTGHFYLMDATTLYRLDGGVTDPAKTVDGGQITPVPIKTGLKGFTVTNNGVLYGTSFATGPGAPSRFWWSGDHGATWVDFSEETFFARGTLMNSIAAADDGHIYLAGDGNGLSLGFYS